MKNYVVVRGAGDLASGVIYRLSNSGFNVVSLETKKPSVIRRTVSFAQAVYDDEYKVEDKLAVKLDLDDVDFEKKINKLLDEKKIPLVVDPQGKTIEILKPKVVIDAILAKKNLGTNIDMADIVIGLGPGFTAGEDVNAVIETMRGHNVGRVIYSGSALKDTGIPGVIGGVAKERVIKSPCAGEIEHIVKISDLVKKGDPILKVSGEIVYASISGVVRGLINEGYLVTKGFKIADIDPRDVKDNCFTISDKARSIGGAVLEAILNLSNFNF
ncbi:selenium-dependent molybdenum cofactor biosynthesis protein YqeB [Helicovermis profundi]|uniref:Selenium-dependent molybdenum cofactor biosynthesis protein YqeB n=1 Tax=Helicovermis profundi TaxID=3065157 RepID=A0AAU9EH05_9FIRM|nr:selenium-dependent molybdenum cofactor biosynthesis protein YqeB [Clostridia bacterium S502]